MARLATSPIWPCVPQSSTPAPFRPQSSSQETQRSFAPPTPPSLEPEFIQSALPPGRFTALACPWSAVTRSQSTTPSRRPFCASAPMGEAALKSRAPPGPPLPPTPILPLAPWQPANPQNSRFMSITAATQPSKSPPSASSAPHPSPLQRYQYCPYPSPPAQHTPSRSPLTQPLRETPSTG